MLKRKANDPEPDAFLCEEVDEDAPPGPVNPFAFATEQRFAHVHSEACACAPEPRPEGADTLELLPGKPAKGEHIGRFFRNGVGTLWRWNGNNPTPACEQCYAIGAVHITQATFKDANGKKTLCALHARESGTYTVSNPCLMCPVDAKVSACYDGKDGKRDQLCAKHAREVGTYTVRNPCTMCPDHAKIQGHHKDKNGRSNQVCALHAHEIGTYEVESPCIMCPQNAKISAGFDGEDGKLKQLCANHAREMGTYEVQNPCSMCPDDAKISANFPDKFGTMQALCASHAREEGTYNVHNPCTLCPADAKIQACYKDFTGRTNLCADHAREVGTYTAVHPCRDCPEGAKLDAFHTDEVGNLQKLCAEHAFRAGVKAKFAPGASMEACACWDRLGKWSGARFANHVHFTPGAAAPTGKEVSGLIPGRRFQPDDFIPPNQPIHIAGETSGAKGAVYLFHGEEWHGGWPEGHQRSGHLNRHGTPYNVLYKLTLESHELYKKQGYRVFVVWGLDFAKACRARAPLCIGAVVKEV